MSSSRSPLALARSLALLALSCSLAACAASGGTSVHPAHAHPAPAAAAEARRLAASAVAAVDRGDLDAALAAFARARALDPSDPEIAYEQAYALYQAHRFAEAAAILEPLANQPPSEVADLVFQLLGNTYDALGQPERAIATYQRGLRAFPSSGRLYFEMGLVDGAHRGVAAAVADWQRGVEVDPAHPSNYFALASSLADSDPLAAALYAEMFMNLERGSPRTARASAIVRASYARLLHDAQTTREITIGDVRPLTVLLHLVVAAAGAELPAEATASTDTLVALHARLLTTWSASNEEDAARTPSPVHRFEAQVAAAGHLEAYERWILGASDGDGGDFATWCTGHDAECSAFSLWFGENRPQLQPGLTPLGIETPPAS